MWNILFINMKSRLPIFILPFYKYKRVENYDIERYENLPWNEMWKLKKRLNPLRPEHKQENLRHSKREEKKVFEMRSNIKIDDLKL